eukprot:4156413-Pyramimonas_sp.AAC.1
MDGSRRRWGRRRRIVSRADASPMHRRCCSMWDPRNVVPRISTPPSPMLLHRCIAGAANAPPMYR